MMTVKKSPTGILVISWLALLISVAVTVDTVIDLAFEQPDVVTASNAASDPGEPDNATEHVLLPSQRADGPDSVPPVLAHSVDFEASFTSPHLTGAVAATRAGPRLEWPIRNSPIAFLRPLRI